MTHTITIPDWLPPLIGKSLGGHWSVKHERRRAATKMLTVMAGVFGVPAATTKRSVRLTLHGWPGKRRLPDRDGWDKLTLDALVRSGLLKDDSPAWLEGRMEVEYVRSESKLTVITLEDC